MTYGSVTNVYYRWVNDVVAGVKAVYPDKKFGLLAYFELEEAPDINLDPAVVPFITSERLRWACEAVETFEQSSNELWELVTNSIGWYDYIYGGQTYDVPRAWYHLMADYLRYGAAHKVKYYYAEAYPDETNWNDGPKLYLTMKLLWDPNIDVNSVLDEWCNGAVGNQAGPLLRSYFDFWENHWTVELPTLEEYFCQPGGTILPSVVYGSMAYMDMLDANELAMLDGIMDDVVLYAGPGKQSDRAALYKNNHDNTVAAVQAYLDTLRDDLLEAMPAIQFQGGEMATISDAQQTGLDFGDNDFIIEIWCKPDTDYAVLLEKGRPGSSGTDGIQMSSSGVSLVTNLKGDTGYALARSSYYMFDRPGHWYHLFIVADRDGQLRYYKNTNEHGGGDISGVGTLDSSDSFRLGYRHSLYYTGVFGPVRVYSFPSGLPSQATLTTAIEYNYDYPDQVAAALLPYIVARWEMDGDVPGVLVDSSANGNNLTLSGNPVRLR